MEGRAMLKKSDQFSLWYILYISISKDNRLSPLTLDYTSLVSAKHFSVRSVKLQSKNQMSRRKGQQRKVQKDDSNWCCDVGWFWVMLLWLLWVNLGKCSSYTTFPSNLCSNLKRTDFKSSGFCLTKESRPAIPNWYPYIPSGQLRVNFG